MVKVLSGSEQYLNLFKPRRIGNLAAPNSVKYAACSVSNLNNRDGSLTEPEYGRMETTCATGAGLITNQGAYPDPEALGQATIDRYRLPTTDSFRLSNVSLGWSRMRVLMGSPSSSAGTKIGSMKSSVASAGSCVCPACFATSRMFAR